MGKGNYLEDNETSDVSNKSKIAYNQHLHPNRVYEKERKCP